jgi:sugar (pentulose or hexulose) kinase
MTDGCASQIAAGAVSPGQYNTTIGTTMVIKGVSQRLLLDPQGRIYCHRHPAGWWLPGGASNTGAECLAAEFGPAETEARSATALNHSPTDLIAYPLVGRGERFPFLAPQAERFLLGTARDRDELFAAYLEGVACLERLGYETLDELGAKIGDTVVSAGGGSRSDAWLQIRADTLNKAVLRPAVPEAAMGAAILAASLAEYETLAEAVRAMVRVERRVEPRAQYLDAYAGKYERFKEECIRRGYLPRPWPS